MGLSFKKAENLLSKLDINKLKKEANEKKIYKSPQEYVCEELKDLIREMKKKQYSYPAMERFLSSNGIKISSAYLKHFCEKNTTKSITKNFNKREYKQDLPAGKTQKAAKSSAIAFNKEDI